MNLFEDAGFQNPVAALKAERAKHADMPTFLGSLAMRFKAEDRDNTLKWMDVITSLASFVDPRDSVLGKDPQRRKMTAFYHGELLGLFVVKACIPDEVRSRIAHVEIGLPHDTLAGEEDPRHVEYAQADTLIAHGQQGLEYFPELTKLIETWSAEVDANIDHQSYVESGFGLLLYTIHEAAEAYRIDQQTQQIIGGAAWQAELSKLLDPPPEK